MVSIEYIVSVFIREKLFLHAPIIMQKRLLSQLVFYRMFRYIFSV